MTGGTIRVSIIGPGLPCLLCSEIVRSDVMAAEALPLKERKARLQEGYLPGIEEAPSVISFTTTAAGMAVSLFIDLIIPYTNLKAETVMMTLNPFELRRLRERDQDLIVHVSKEKAEAHCTLSLSLDHSESFNII